MSDNDVSPFVFGDVVSLRDSSAFVRSSMVASAWGLSDGDIVFAIAQFNVIQAYVSDVLTVLRAEALRREQLAVPEV